MRATTPRDLNAHATFVFLLRCLRDARATVDLENASLFAHPAMVRAIRARLPKMPVLFMSGYAEEQLRRDIDIPDMHFIPKPFGVAAIGDKVGAVLRQAKAEQAEAEAAAK